VPTQRSAKHISSPQIDDETAYAMLRTDFEQAFVVHNAYRATEQALYQLSLRVIAFPLVIAGALLSAGLIRSTARMDQVVQNPVIALALVAAALLNTVVVRAYVSNDRVQTEAKHQVNRLRSLYLSALADQFPSGWKPVWGSTNPYLDTNVKFKAAALSPVLLGCVNGLYVGYGVSSLIGSHLEFAARIAVATVVGAVFFAGQLEAVWQFARTRWEGARG
jgi:hypothetical protein